MQPPKSLPINPMDAAREWPWYCTRLVRGGPPVPCRLQCLVMRDEVGDVLGVDYVADIDGETTDYQNPRGWPWGAITEEEWKYLTDLAEWCRKYSPNEPMANPLRPMKESEAKIV